MNDGQVLNHITPDVAARSASTRWLATVVNGAPIVAPGYHWRRVGPDGPCPALYSAAGTDTALPASAERYGCAVVFGGVLHNGRDLQEVIGELPPAHNDAELVLAGYVRWGEDILQRLRGVFALIIWDSVRNTLLCVRDPLGIHPMFYAESGHTLFVSPSIDVLIRQPHVSGSVNRAALADYLLDRFPILDETFFSSVRRVPPGNVLRVVGEDRRTYRYWDPAPEGSITWIRPADLGRFDELLDAAVNRCLSVGPAGIFLSGGLDSVMVATVAAEQSRALGMPRPWALSLIFPDPEVNEEVVQRSVATQLGLPQLVVPFYEAVGRDGLLAPALEMSRSLPAPLLNTWLPAYRALATEGQRRGCRVILTGGGGDEWLTISPLLTADLLRAFDIAGVYRLWQSLRRSHRRPDVALLRNLLWRFGVRPILVPSVRRFVGAVAPWALKFRRRLLSGPPRWIARDGALRQQLDRRLEEHSAKIHRETGSFYVREARTALEHSLVSWESEEVFETSSRVGVRIVQTFWDPDLVDLLYRTPPFLLNRGGRSKGLVRESLARRFPDLGFEQQKKVDGTEFYSSVILQEGRRAWQALGGATALAGLGIIDQRYLSTAMEQILGRGEPRKTYRVWSILNAETWVRARV